MKVAVVTGGFNGIRDQHLVWRLEREVEECKLRAASAARQATVAMHTLRNRIIQLEAAEVDLARRKT